MEKEFAQLAMGRLTHAAFRAEWEYCLEELEDAGVERPSTDVLYRKYLRSIPSELRAAILRQSWQIGGEGPPRKPTSWEELADCVDQELETRADANAPVSDGYHMATTHSPAQPSEELKGQEA